MRQHQLIIEMSANAKQEIISRLLYALEVTEEFGWMPYVGQVGR